MSNYILSKILSKPNRHRSRRSNLLAHLSKLDENKTYLCERGGIKFVIRRIGRQYTITAKNITVLVNDLISILVLVENGDFTGEGNVLLDVLINGKTVTEEKAFRALAKIQKQFINSKPMADVAVQKTIFNIALFVNRIYRMPIQSVIYRRLKTGTKISLQRSERTITLKNTSGMMLVLRTPSEVHTLYSEHRQAKRFYENLAAFIHAESDEDLRGWLKTIMLDCQPDCLYRYLGKNTVLERTIDNTSLLADCFINDTSPLAATLIHDATTD